MRELMTIIVPSSALQAQPAPPRLPDRKRRADGDQHGSHVVRDQLGGHVQHLVAALCERPVAPCAPTAC